MPRKAKENQNAKQKCKRDASKKKGTLPSLLETPGISNASAPVSALTESSDDLLSCAAIVKPSQVQLLAEQARRVKERDDVQQRLKAEVAAPLRKRFLMHEQTTPDVEQARPSKKPRLDSRSAEVLCEFDDLLLLDLTAPEARQSASSVLISRHYDDSACVCPYGLIPATESASSSAAAPRADPAPFRYDETLVVLDWDNTILPSTWLFTVQHEPVFKVGDRVFWVHSNEHVPDGAVGVVLGFNNAQAYSVRVQFPKGTWLFDPLQLVNGNELMQVADSVTEILDVAEQYGTVVLITNAEEGWIQRTCQKYLPMLFSRLTKLKLLSARSTYSSPDMTCPIDWKFHAFKSEIERVFGIDASQDHARRKHLLSIGDGPEEREAILRCASLLPNCTFKSIKLIEQPDMVQMSKQQSLVLGCLDGVSSNQGNLDLVVTSKLWYDVI